MNKLLGFRGALIASMIFLITAALIVSNWLSYITHRDSTIATVNASSISILHYEANKIETWFQTRSHLVDTLARHYNNGVLQDDLVGIARLTNAIGDTANIYFGFEDGTAYSSAAGRKWNNGVANPDLYEARKRSWYIQAKTSKVLDLTEVYTDSTTGKKVVSIIKYMGDGAVLADIELDILAKTVKDINYPGAVALITDGSGKVLASNSNLVSEGQRVSDIAGLEDVGSKMLSRESLMQDYTLEGIDKLAFTKKIKLVNGKRWYLFIAVDKSIAYAELETSLTRAVFSSSVLIIIAIFLMLAALQILYRPILLLKEMVSDLSTGNGDLTRRLPVVSQDDLGKISESINLFISNLQVMMTEVLQATNHIGTNIENLKSESDANSQILSAHTIEAEQIVAAIEEMSATAHEVARNGNETASLTQMANAQAVQSKETVGLASSTVEQLVREVENTERNIAEIDRDTVNITNVLKVIGDIADQTNLLALNAAIEAARAGEQGRGFAVVADEVRALAARTQTSTAEIEQTLKKLRSGSIAAISAMEMTKSTCLKTSKATEMVATDLDAIGVSVNTINDLNTQIATAAEEQSSVSNDITRNMATISDMAAELATNGKATLEQALDLATANSQLRSLVGQFKLS